MNNEPQPVSAWPIYWFNENVFHMDKQIRQTFAYKEAWKINANHNIIILCQYDSFL